MENAILVEQAVQTPADETLGAKAKAKIKKTFASASAIMTAVMTTVMTASASGSSGTSGWGQSVTVNTSASPNADDLMGNVIGILLTITRFVGVALLIYGVYEIVMSFMQSQPEAKTKGIVMALSGVVMIALKSVIQGFGIIS
jgi:hypothetical protein